MPSREKVKIKEKSVKNGVTIYVLDKVMTDSKIASKEGDYFKEKHFGLVIKDNADVYAYDSIKHKKGKLLLRIRKKVIPKSLTDKALDSFVEAAKKKHENRGSAAGTLDRKKLRGYVGKLINTGKYRTGYISNKTNKVSGQLYSNLAPSNIVGFFDKADRNLKGHGAPCRLTAFNRDNVEKWKQAIPFIQKVNRVFKKLVPGPYKKQRARAKKTPKFIIPETCFSTITINYSWRTALHKDSGDFKDGYGNLVVIEDPNNKHSYDGCYIGFPQFGVCADVRTGDFIAMDVHEWHCNTEFRPRKKSKSRGGWRRSHKRSRKSRKSRSRSKKRSSKRGNRDDKYDRVNRWHYNRLSMVFYLREGMLKCTNLKNTKNKEGYLLKSRKSLEKQ